MIGKVIGAFVGDKVAKQTTAIGGPTGAALGVVATTVLSRLSLPAMIALGAGGYLAKKYFDRQQAVDKAAASPPQTSTAPKAKAA